MVGRLNKSSSRRRCRRRRTWPPPAPLSSASSSSALFRSFEHSLLLLLLPPPVRPLVRHRQMRSVLCDDHRCKSVIAADVISYSSPPPPLTPLSLLSHSCQTCHCQLKWSTRRASRCSSDGVVNCYDGVCRVTVVGRGKALGHKTHNWTARLLQ